MNQGWFAFVRLLVFTLALAEEEPSTTDDPTDDILAPMPIPDDEDEVSTT